MLMCVCRRNHNIRVIIARSTLTPTHFPPQIRCWSCVSWAIFRKTLDQDETVTETVSWRRTRVRERERESDETKKTQQQPPKIHHMIMNCWVLATNGQGGALADRLEEGVRAATATSVSGETCLTGFWLEAAFSRFFAVCFGFRYPRWRFRSILQWMEWMKEEHLWNFDTAHAVHMWELSAKNSPILSAIERTKNDRETKPKTCCHSTPFQPHDRLVRDREKRDKYQALIARIA